MFLQSLFKLNNSISARNFPPKFRQIQKKKSLPHSGFISVRNFEFLVAKWVLLARKRRQPEIFRPLLCQTRGGAAPRPPQNRRLCMCLCFNQLFFILSTFFLQNSCKNFHVILY